MKRCKLSLGTRHSFCNDSLRVSVAGAALGTGDTSGNKTTSARWPDIPGREIRKHLYNVTELVITMCSVKIKHVNKQDIHQRGCLRKVPMRGQY